eukprot:CAMPEP_0171455598 /NCGR_PEP_ID=MMETSP0945-20130129/2428_1 /TAXON_ID=109269 /ORGANISM="Vaucheria litorea, Strain CCMP2940" /LENGTH=320 /DNA_ID=CAMNT_0011980869 /DNA_START=257 /DNA_END=1219 /DNA_ORIENTATION=+
MRGWRKSQEDMAVVFNELAGANEALLCGVFDGHSGGNSSSYAAKNIFPSVVQTEAWKSENYEEALIEGFLTLDKNLRTIEPKDGTTAVCAVVTAEKIWVANCGDSRAILCRGGVAVSLSQDHKPDVYEESQRIYRAGGFVEYDSSPCPRVMAPNCYLAMATSRTLGDFHFKLNDKRPQDEQIVSPKPAVSLVSRSDLDQFIILASDGIWDVMKNQELCDLLIAEAALAEEDPKLRKEKQITSPNTSSPTSLSLLPTPSTGESRDRNSIVGRLAKAILAHCFARGTMDNCSIIIVDMRGSEKVEGPPAPPSSLTEEAAPES